MLYLADWSFTRGVHEHSSGGAIVAAAVSDTGHSVEQGRIPDGMLAASHRISAGHVGVWSGLPLITPWSSTRVSLNTQALPKTPALAGMLALPERCWRCRTPLRNPICGRLRGSWRCRKSERSPTLGRFPTGDRLRRPTRLGRSRRRRCGLAAHPRNTTGESVGV